MLTNMTEVSLILGDPNPNISLDQLAVELNKLAKIRNNARIAFCKRLAVAYLMIVGHLPRNGSSDGKKFYRWCGNKIRSGNGKAYTFSTLRTYLRVGLSKDPAKLLAQFTTTSNKREQQVRQLGANITRAALSNDPPKVISIRVLKKTGYPSNVAQEINVLMTAWERASPQARSQFIYLVAGRKIAS